MPKADEANPVRRDKPLRRADVRLLTAAGDTLLCDLGTWWLCRASHDAAPRWRRVCLPSNAKESC